MKRINKKGFTLVELLAVIVVLAIVMLIAVSAVLPQMEKARRQTLALEAQTAIESAQTYFMSKSISGKSGEGLPASEGGESCVSIQTLINDGQFTTRDGSYTGAVRVKKQGNVYLYEVWLQKDTTWMIVGKGTAGTYSAPTAAGAPGGATNVKIHEGYVSDYGYNKLSADNKQQSWPGTTSESNTSDMNTAISSSNVNTIDATVCALATWVNNDANGE